MTKEVSILLSLKEDVERERYRRSLYAFIKGFWSVVESAIYRDSWHIKAVCEHLQAVEEGKIKRLIVNIPPRHSKSLIISVFFPIWCWIRKPSYELFTGSYSKELAIRDTTKSRYILQSEKFIKLFGDTFSLAKDQNQKSFYRNSHNGTRQAFSIMGSLTGAGGDIILIDDPLNADDAYSDVTREGCNRWFDEALTTRLNDQETGSIVVIMQRLHMMDLTGHLLKKGGWEHLCLPMRFDLDRKCKTSIFEDPRIENGDMLNAYWRPETLKQLQSDMGSYAFGSQYQQWPTMLEGGLIKMAWWKYYAESKLAMLRKKPILISLDTAFKTGRQNDYSVCTVWAQERIDNDNYYYLLDMYRDKLEFPELKKLLTAIISKYRPYMILIEDAASGQSLIQEFRRISNCVITPVKADRDKITRVHAVAPMIESGKVLLNESAAYLVDVYKEFTDFPMGEHDDIVDSFTQALIYMRDVGARIPRAYYL